MKILVVDDDFYIQQLVAIHLGREGYTVFKASDAEQALMLLEEETVDLAIVDVMMPGMDGFELTRLLTQDLDVPVILLTAKGQLEDKEKGFLSGTEDYMVKPFEPKELLFRVAVVLRRFERSIQEILHAGNLSINRRNFEVAINNETLILPLKEFELLSLLVSRANMATPRSLLLEHVWGEDNESNEMTLNTHINRIRDRLKRYGANVEIHTLRGIGYKLEAPK
ncbi:response regulator transcription factor [Planococcus shenhongbingii]|uniref:Heme response regulator HssR n=1 Tax=Planococcus shenhongbingii TaxID=3058398 RepID=A0ABT8NEB3_9BACL|nr:response regulator transcription factor [Planococcus sp. N017]MDN7246226.1 response regulator transcription factor [Planococcus sp. N017]